MSYPIYKINIPNENIVLNFCLEEEMKSDNVNDKCMNMYIYDDDTIIEVINKIKIGLINHIEDFNEKKFEDISGYLTGQWTYYNDISKLKEYIYLNIFTKDTCSIEKLNEKLGKINKFYNRENLIDITDYNNITINNIDLSKLVDINSSEMVIGYYDRNSENFFKYYIGKNEIVNNLNKVIENEFNKTINSYYNININEEKIIKNSILEYNFYIVEDLDFIKNNYISIPKYLEGDINTKEFLENIYIKNTENRMKLGSYSEKRDFEEKLYNIQYLNLEIHNYENIDFISKYNSIELNESMPLCILSEKKNRKNSKTYKVLKKKNKMPFLSQSKLNDIIDNIPKSSYRDYVLYKIYLKKNGKKTDHFIDVYLVDNRYFYIKFNKNTEIITIDHIVENINNILNLLNIKILDKENITKDEFYYLNDTNSIKLNNDLEYKSNKFILEININNSRNEMNKFLNFISIFNTFFDIQINNLSVNYLDEKGKKKTNIITKIDPNEETIELGKTKPKILLELSSINENEFTFVGVDKIQLYYKKSYNYDSYNYIEKYFKNIVSFNEKDVIRSFKCSSTGLSDEEGYDRFLTNNFKEGFLKSKIEIKDNNEEIRDLIEYIKQSTKTYECENIKKNTNQKCLIDLRISGNIIFIELYNIYSFNDIHNICKLFDMYKFYSLNFNTLFKLNSTTRLEYPKMSPYMINDNNIYNIYNNIYNKYNLLHSINDNFKNSYYVFSIYSYFLKIVNVDETEDYDSFEYDSDSDEYMDNDNFSSSDNEDDMEQFDSINQYLSQYNTIEDNLWENIMENYDQNAKKICLKNRRPSVVPGRTIKIILEKELNNKIEIKKDKKFKKKEKIEYEFKKPFIENFDLHPDTINKNIDENFKSSLKIYMGRQYKFNVKSNKKFILLFTENEDIIPIETFNDLKKNEDIYFEIKNVENNSLISLENYIDSDDNEFEFIINFPLTDFNQENADSITNINKIYKLGICTKNNFNKKYDKFINIDLHLPSKYYYDEKKYGDNFFIDLPQLGKSGTLWGRDPRMKINSILCFYTEIKAQKGAPSDFKDLTNNKKIEITSTIIDENTFQLNKFKIAVVPKIIYKNICSFLSLELDENNYYNSSSIIKSKQPYRFGIRKNTRIHNLLHSIIIINKLSSNKLPKTIENKFELNNTKNISILKIKQALIDCIYDSNILNETALIKLNNNVFYKNDTLKILLNAVKLPNNENKIKNFNLNTSLDKIRNKMKEYIEETFENMDLYFIWNLCSIIFNINIIIFDLEYKNTLKFSIKCPLVNNYKIYEFDKERKTCFIFKFENTYQPLTIPRHSGSNFIYDILFNIKNDGSFTNLNNLFNKCLLKYNNNSYNTLLMNSLYHNINYTNNIIINTNEILKIEDYIKYIVINEDYIKLGLVFEIEKEFLFIPINYLKHNINYNLINDTIYTYIYSTNNNKFIHDFDKTKILIQKFFNIHNNEKLYFNNKYITKNNKIIGIGLLIGDYIPIKSIEISEIKLEKTDELISEDISFINNENDEEIDLENYNRFEYTNLYYTQFIYSILDKIQLLDNKNEINRLINEENSDDIKIEELIIYLDKILKNNFKISEKMYLHNKKPTHNIESDIITCHTLEKTDCDVTNNCSYDNDNNCKYIITEYYYRLFIKFLANDLCFNHYKKHLLLSLNKNTKISNLDNKYIILETEGLIDKNKEKDLKNKINVVYNKIITDDHFYSIGENYDNTNKNNSNIDDKFCRLVKKNEDLNITYYAMKSLVKKNIIAYSNCIYYNLSKLENKNVNELRYNIANEIKNKIQDNLYNIYDIINYYSEHNNSHLYTNIVSVEDLSSILNSSEHWITELDLYIYSQLYQKKIYFYKLNTEPIPNFPKGCYMVMNENESTFTEIKIYEEDFYYKKLYYLIIDND